MKKIFTLVLLMASCISYAFAQEMVPEGLQKVINDYFKNSTNARDLLFVKNTVQAKFSDIYAGEPVKVFLLDINKLEQLSDTATVEQFIKSINKWDIPVCAHGKCIYTITARCKNNNWYISSVSSGEKTWNRMREVWPENEGTHIIKIDAYPYEFLHFPQKGKYNLTELADTADFKVLDDSRKTIARLKQMKKQADEWSREHPEIENGGNNAK